VGQVVNEHRTESCDMSMPAFSRLCIDSLLLFEKLKSALSFDNVGL
jgi:hypothetical protein